MAKTRGAHSFRPRVLQGPTPPAAGPSVAGPAASGPSIGSVAASPSPAVSPSAAAAGAGPSVPTARPTADAASPAPAAGDAEGSSSVASAQRRYHTRVGLTPPAPSHPRPARWAPPAKRARTQAQGSHLHLDPGCRPLHLIKVFPEPQTYLRGPSSGDLTSLMTPSRGMLAVGIEISMGRCTTISRHFLRTRGSETPCSSYSDTIWSHSWCRVSTIILGSSPSSIIR